MTQPTPYPDLNALLEAFSIQARASLGDDLIGVYLVGSFALGGFDDDSDVDFLVVTRGDLTPVQEAEIQAMHGRLYDLKTPWAKHLEGSYISAVRLRRGADGSALLYLDNTARVLIWSPHCNTRVMRWTLHEHGIALAGPDPKTLVQPVNPDEFRQEAAEVMQKWKVELDVTPEMLENGWLQPYAVVTFCRLLFTVQTGTVISKLGAVRWGQEVLDPRWSRLIEQAWLERPDPSLKSQQKSNPEDARETLEFVRYALEFK